MANQPFEAAPATSGRTLVGRLKPGSDLILGLEAVCDNHDVGFAAIVFAYGSLTRATFKVLQREGDGREVLVRQDIDERLEFLGGQGLVCQDLDGRRATHLHGSVAGRSGTVLGGHFEPNHNPIYNNLDFAIVELHDVRLVRAHDAETDTVEMQVHPMRGK